MAINNKPHAEGGVREMMALALPMVVSYGCDTIMMFCDRLLLSKLGPDLMNAAVAGGVAAFLMVSFGFGMLGYGTALVAQYLGAQQKQNCPAVTSQSWILAVVLYLIVLALRPFVVQLFSHAGVPESQLAAQIAYFDIMSYGSILVFVRHSLASFFSGIGRTRVVMTASLLAMVVNVIASFILIYGHLGFPALGIRGAAYGTLFASFCAILMLARAFFSKQNQAEFGVAQAIRFDPAVMQKLLRYGFPSGVEMLLTLLAANAFVLSFHSLGPVVATASSVLMNWDIAAYIPLMGMEIGVTSLVGRYMGAGRPEIAHRVTMSGLKVGCVYAAVLFIWFGLLAQPMVEIFRPIADQAVFAAALPMAVVMLRLVSLYLFSIVLVIVFIGALRGAGDTLWAMGYHVTLHWLSAAALYASTRFLGFTAVQGWMCVIAVFMVFSVGAWLRYRQGKWRGLRVVGTSS